MQDKYFIISDVDVVVAYRKSTNSGGSATSPSYASLPGVTVEVIRARQDSGTNSPFGKAARPVCLQIFTPSGSAFAQRTTHEGMASSVLSSASSHRSSSVSSVVRDVRADSGGVSDVERRRASETRHARMRAYPADHGLVLLLQVIAGGIASVTAEKQEHDYTVEWANDVGESGAGLADPAVMVTLVLVEDESLQRGSFAETVAEHVVLTSATVGPLSQQKAQELVSAVRASDGFGCGAGPRFNTVPPPVPMQLNGAKEQHADVRVGSSPHTVTGALSPPVAEVERVAEGPSSKRAAENPYLALLRNATLHAPAKSRVYGDAESSISSGASSSAINFDGDDSTASATSSTTGTVSTHRERDGSVSGGVHVRERRGTLHLGMGGDDAGSARSDDEYLVPHRGPLRRRPSLRSGLIASIPRHEVRSPRTWTRGDERQRAADVFARADSDVMSTLTESDFGDRWDGAAGDDTGAASDPPRWFPKPPRAADDAAFERPPDPTVTAASAVAAGDSPTDASSGTVPFTLAVQRAPELGSTLPPSALPQPAAPSVVEQPAPSSPPPLPAPPAAVAPGSTAVPTQEKPPLSGTVPLPSGSPLRRGPMSPPHRTQVPLSSPRVRHGGPLSSSESSSSQQSRSFAASSAATETGTRNVAPALHSAPPHTAPKGLPVVLSTTAAPAAFRPTGNSAQRSSTASENSSLPFMGAPHPNSQSYFSLTHSSLVPLATAAAVPAAEPSPPDDAAINFDEILEPMVTLESWRRQKPQAGGSAGGAHPLRSPRRSLRGADAPWSQNDRGSLSPRGANAEEGVSPFAEQISSPRLPIGEIASAGGGDGGSGGAAAAAAYLQRQAETTANSDASTAAPALRQPPVSSFTVNRPPPAGAALTPSPHRPSLRMGSPGLAGQGRSGAAVTASQHGPFGAKAQPREDATPGPTGSGCMANILNPTGPPHVLFRSSSMLLRSDSDDERGSAGSTSMAT